MRWLSKPEGLQARYAGSLLLVALLAGCASTPPVSEAPTSDLLMDCPAPAVRVKTNGEMADTLSKYRTALKECNDDKAALREFYKEK